MQKVINVLAVLSFVGTAGIIGGGTVVYLRRDAIAESVKERVAKAATEAIAGALPAMMDAALPELPAPLVVLFLLLLSNMKKFMMALLQQQRLPYLLQYWQIQLKTDEYFTPHAQWGACYFRNAPIMFKNSKQFLTSINTRNWLIVITVLLLMSLTLSSDHLIRSELRFF